MIVQRAQERIDENPHLREYVRRQTGVFRVAKKLPIQVVEGSFGPTIKGEPYHFTTLNGEPVTHLSACTNWNDIVYHPSTRRVEVGVRWLAKARVFGDEG